MFFGLNESLFRFQVALIRKALRKRNTALKEVTVERVQGVQGMKGFGFYFVCCTF